MDRPTTLKSEGGSRHAKGRVEQVAAENHKDAHFTTYSKLGKVAIFSFAIGIILLLASVGFLWFLWLAGDGDLVWRRIADGNWITRGVALFSLIIRQSAPFQTSAATAMVAALALEWASVLLLNLASLSTTRNANGGPYMLCWWLWKSSISEPHKAVTWAWVAMITALACANALLQLTSFALLSDLDIAVVRSSNSSMTAPTHFQYSANGTIPIVTHGTTWSQQLQSYVSFADYHEPAPELLPDGVVDTGVTLRSFLPVSDQQTRGMIADWDGIANVLDARALCVRPKLFDPGIHYADRVLGFEARFLPDLPNPMEWGLHSDVSGYGSCDAKECASQVACILPLQPLDILNPYGSYEALNSQWRLTITQPQDTVYTLRSVFNTPQDTGREQTSATTEVNYSFGDAYVVVNISSGLASAWANAIPGEDPNDGTFHGPGTSPLGYGVHGQNGEWYDLIYSEDASLNISISVCYTAFDTSDLNVQMQAYGNHSDMTPMWNHARHDFNFTDIRIQLGQDANGSATYADHYAVRNIMQLVERKSWIPSREAGDYLVPPNRVTETSWITDYANMAGALQDNFQGSFGANWTTFMWTAYALPNFWNQQLSFEYADASLVSLVQEILQKGGSLAFVMQSIVTSLTELAYYQQIQQLNGVSDVTSSRYILASVPVRKRGLIAVTAVVGVHVVLIFGVILPAFLAWTKISALGNAWQAIAQVIDARTDPILRKAALATDGQAEDEVKYPVGKKGKRVNRDLVGIEAVDSCKVHVIDSVPRRNVKVDVEGRESSSSDGNGAAAVNEERNALLSKDPDEPAEEVQTKLGRSKTYPVSRRR